MNIRKKTYGFDDLLLVPKKTDLETRSQVSLKTQLNENLKFSIPIISANMDTITEWEMCLAMDKLGGLGIVHRYMPLEDRLKNLDYVMWTKKALSVGVTEEEIEIGKVLIDNDIDILCLDIAHGHSVMMERALWILKDYAIQKNKRICFIAGNVATPEGASDLVKWGADAVKVGIGPGSMCTTRIMTGAGYGQLTAIHDCKKAVGYSVPVIADGGIRNSGDIVKALAAGASFVMLGKLLAGTKEVPQWAREKGIYRGMASYDAQKDFYKNLNNKHEEGVAVEVERKGSVQEIIPKLMSAVRSGFSYCGARNLEELWENAEFVECTYSVIEESRPHGKNQS